MKIRSSGSDSGLGGNLSELEPRLKRIAAPPPGDFFPDEIRTYRFQMKTFKECPLAFEFVEIIFRTGMIM